MFRVFCFIYYVLCPIPGLLWLSSLGSMMGSGVGPKLTRAIIALTACPILTLSGLIAVVISIYFHRESTKGLVIATAIAASPGVFAIIGHTSK